VEDYYKKMKILMIRVNIMEDRETIISKLLNGLNIEITNMVKS